MMNRMLSRCCAMFVAAGLLLGAANAQAEPQAEAMQPSDQSAREQYWQAHRALADGDWNEAYDDFRELERDLRARKQAGVDSAIYWQASALLMGKRLGEVDREVQRLMREFPDSPWVDEARALHSGEDGMHQGMAALSRLDRDLAQVRGDGRPRSADPAEQDALDAIDALMATDNPRAIPILERVLGSTHSDGVKARALFVLVQLDAGAASRQLDTILKGSGSIYLKREAIKMLAFGGDKNSLDRLNSLYAQQTEVSLRKAVLQAWMLGQRGDLLANAAASEPDAELRREAINLLGAMDDGAALEQLFGQLKDPKAQADVLRALGVAGEHERLQRLAQGAREETLQRAALEGLGIAGGSKAKSAIAQIYRQAASAEIKRAAINGFIICGGGKELLALYREETDVDLKRQLMQALVITDGDAAIDAIDERLK